AREVAESDRLAVLPRQHQAAQFFGLVAAGVAQFVLLAADLDRTAGDVGRTRRLVRDVGQRYAEAGGLRGVDGDAHFVRRPGVDDHLRDARHRLDARLDRVFDEVPVLLHRPRRAGQQLDEEPGERLVRVAAALAAAAELDNRAVRVARD